jgi:hypothetical protein
MRVAAWLLPGPLLLGPLLAACGRPTIYLVVVNQRSEPIIVETSTSTFGWKLEADESGPDLEMARAQVLYLYDAECRLLASEDLSVYALDPTFTIDDTGVLDYQVPYLGGDPGPPDDLEQVTRCAL